MIDLQVVNIFEPDFIHQPVDDADKKAGIYL